ncbi:sugar ABC transporter substrate-binding protein [Neobacillus sp. DY30]|uniref:ABC transporter substrate-binding protein n=1 Tax=Neobacillus sp. DY30 TaxID=3047871 RepID=UPI0024BF80FD|nr:sugar ABC transporter substrate-binding protein [Neobacillus sp. DY30]WHY02487.1 sugar ABC transporter substrate-binding protein [Neobacillus sp. DY30]
MKQSLKTISTFFITLILLLIISACANNPSPKEKIESDNTKKVTLDFLWFSDGVEGKVMKEIIKDYQAKNQNVEINLIEVAYQDLNTKLKRMIAGGEPPALARITDTGNFADFALDLTPYVGGAEEFTSQFLPAIKPYYVKGSKIIAAPMDVTANCIIYNKTLFIKAGVQVPQTPDEVWTWDEFVEALKTVKEKGGAKHGLLVDFTPRRYSTLVYQFGGSLMTEDGSAPAINNENGVAALDYFIKLHKDAIIPESVWLGVEDPIKLFRSGQAAAHLSGNWILSNYSDIENFEWGVTYLPKKEIRSSVPGGKYIMGFKNTEVEDETADFIEYLASKKVNAEFNQESLLLSSRLDNNELNYEFGKEMFKIFSNELENTPLIAAEDWRNQEVISQVSSHMRDSIMKALNGEVTSQEAMNAVAEKIKEAIEGSHTIQNEYRDDLPDNLQSSNLLASY